MIRRPHRVNFRLSDAEKSRYAGMIGNLLYVNNWTDLCLKGLEELHAKYGGLKAPLATTPWAFDNGLADFSGVQARCQTGDHESDKESVKKKRPGRFKDESGRVVRRLPGKKSKKSLASRNGKK